MKKYADIIVEFYVEFDDDGVNDLRDQAIEAAFAHGLDGNVMDINVVGNVRDTEFPK